MVARALREEQVEADRLIEAVESSLALDADLLEQEELELIERKLIALKELKSKTQDPHLLRRSTESLSKATDEFAAKRMNAGIKRALAGKNVSEI